MPGCVIRSTGIVDGQPRVFLAMCERISEIEPEMIAAWRRLLERLEGAVRQQRGAVP